MLHGSAKALTQIHLAHADSKGKSGDLKGAAELYVNASRPDLAIALYSDNEMWEEAQDLSKQYLPHRANEILKASQRKSSNSSRSIPSLTLTAIPTLTIHNYNHNHNRSKLKPASNNSGGVMDEKKRKKVGEEGNDNKDELFSSAGDSKSDVTTFSHIDLDELAKSGDWKRYDHIIS